MLRPILRAVLLRRFSAAPGPPAAVAPAAAAPPPAAAPAAAPRLKGKNHFKRASEVMAAVKRDAVERMFVKMAAFRPPLPSFNVGDAVKVEYAQEIADADTMPIYGTVMAKRRAGLDEKFTLINVRFRSLPLPLTPLSSPFLLVLLYPPIRARSLPRAPPPLQNMENEWFKATYVTSSPLLRGVKVLQRNRVSDGKKRARRAKLTDLMDALPTKYQVDESTKELSEVQADKAARKLLRRAGKEARGKVKKETRGGKGALAKDDGKDKD